MAEDRTEWRARVVQEGPSPCPCCDRVPKLRVHRFTSTMSLVLIHLYHRDDGLGNPVTDVPAKLTSGDSLHKLELWQLIVAKGDGHVLTALGRAAALGRVTITPRCTTLNGVPADFSGEPVFVRDTLDQRWNYDDLMAKEGA